MIKITRQEREIIRALFPNVACVRTMIGRSERHTYYVPEFDNIRHFIKRFRNDPVYMGNMIRNVLR